MLRPRAAATGQYLRWHPATWAAFAIFVAGLLLRVFGVRFGLPFIYDPDEPLLVERAFRMLATGDPSPHWFGHPDTTLMYLSAAAYGLYGKLGLAAGWFHSFADVAAEFAAEPSTFYLITRCIVVAFAAATIPLTYALARQVTGRYASLFAAAIIAIAPLHAEHSRLARPDAPQTFLMLASTWFIVGIATRGRWRDYLLAGFLLGLAVATKYPALVLALIVVLAHVLRQREAGRAPWADLQRLFAAGLATLVGAFAGSPFMFIELPKTLLDIAAEAQGNRVGVVSPGFVLAVWTYISVTLRANIGVSGLLLTLLGGWSVLRQRRPAGLVVVATTFLFLVFISSLSMRWDRWIIPVLPYVAILAAAGLADAGSLARRVTPAWAASLLVAALAAATLVPPATNVILNTVARSRADTRSIAWQWIMDNVPPGSRILAEAYTPHLPEGRFNLYTVDEGEIWPLPRSARTYAVPRGILGWLRDPDLVERMHIDYVIISNNYDRRLWEPERFKREILVYEDVMRRGTLVYAIEPADGVADGLPVRIYRMGP